MVKITLDTNTLSLSSILETLGDFEADIAVTSVTAREVEGTSFEGRIRQLPQVSETFVLGESRLGFGVLGDEAEADRFEALLRIISDGSFPAAGQRDNLTDGQRRQLRDAMILNAHAREGRDIFVTNDVKAVGEKESEKRRQLSGLLKTRIMTAEEFVQLCRRGGPVR